MANLNSAAGPGHLLGDYIDLNSLRGGWDEGLLALMYHAIEVPPLGYRLRYLYVDPRRLRAQLLELQATGARFVSAAEAAQNRARDRQVLITLDDGFQNVFTNALPVFRELGVPAITYIVAGQLGGSNVWDHGKGLQERPLMSESEIRDWVAAGYEIGSHTVSHHKLTEISLNEARREIFESKKILEDLIGQPVRHFCYPYGRWNAAVRELVMEAGYETACTVEGGYNFPETDPFALRRLTARHRHPYSAAWSGAVRSLMGGTR